MEANSGEANFGQIDMFVVTERNNSVHDIIVWHKQVQ